MVSGQIESAAVAIFCVKVRGIVKIAALDRERLFANT